MSDFSKLSKNLNKQNIDKISLLTRFNFLVSNLKESVFLDLNCQIKSEFI